MTPLSAIYITILLLELQPICGVPICTLSLKPFPQKKIDLWTAPRVNFSPISLKLIRTYPHIVENWEITMAPLFLRLILWKSPPQSIRLFVKLDFFKNDLAVWCVFVFTKSNSWLHQKISNIMVLTVAKMWILNWLGKTFSCYQSQN